MIGCLLYTPQLGTGPTTQACALTGNKTSILLSGMMLNQLSYTGQGLIRLSVLYEFVGPGFEPGSS